MKPGDILDGRYTIIDRLGAGGMGEVYKATHTILGAPRVIKVVHPHISSNDDARERFLREARASTKVQHPNVATLHDFASTADGAHYMVWEYIDGVNLAQKLRALGTLPPRQAVRIAIQALHGLEAIHRAGIIHRDISPENLMITDGDQVKIIDLGVAKVDDTEAVSQTRTGIFVGKLRYAAPEQLGFLPDDEKIDARADIYALAMVLVELLTGRPPYEAKSPHEYYVLHAREPQQRTVSLPPELPGSAALEAILEKALARDRTQRFGSAREFAEALEAVERTLPAGADVPTLAIPLAPEDLRQGLTARDTLHRTTLQSDASDQQTVRTPLPAAPTPAAPTVLTPLPDVPQARTRRGLNPVWIVGLVALVVLAAGAAIFWPRHTEPAQIAEAGTSTSTQAGMIPSAASQTTLTVTSEPELLATTSSAPATIAPPTESVAPVVPTATVPPPAAEPKPRRREQPDPPPAKETRPEPAAKPDPAIPTFVDGGGDETANERALELARQELQGTRQFALRAGSMQVELARAIREHFADAEFVPYAPVVIRFDGTMERLGRGRKRRAATATVLKNDRVVFRYELPDEVYRVGMTPPEAFSNVLSDLVE